MQMENMLALFPADGRLRSLFGPVFDTRLSCILLTRGCDIFGVQLSICQLQLPFFSFQLNANNCNKVFLSFDNKM